MLPLYCCAESAPHKQLLLIAFMGWALLLATMPAASGSAAAPAAQWWDPNYPHRQPISVQTGSAAVPAGYSVAFTFDHAALVGSGSSQAAGDDLRIVRWNGTSWTELDRVLEPGTAFNDPSTEMWFAVQSGIAGSSSDDDYYLYYGHPDAVDPPSDESNVFHFADFFDRLPADVVGQGWVVTEGTGDIDIAADALFFNITSNSNNRPLADHAFSPLTSGLAWQVGFDWEETGSDSAYRLHMQLGNSAAMDDPPDESNFFSKAGVGPNMLWASTSQGMSQQEGFGYEASGSVTELQAISGPTTIEAFVDVTSDAYDVYVNGSLSASGVPFTSSVATINQLRFLSWQISESQFAGRRFSHTFVRQLVTPEPTVVLGPAEGRTAVPSISFGGLALLAGLVVSSVAWARRGR